MNDNSNVTKKQADKQVEKQTENQAVTQPQRAAAETALLPPVDVVEDAGGITLYADMPGVPKDKLSLRMEADSLTIEGELALDMPQDMESSHAEVRLPRYRRTFALSRDLDSEKASAEFQQGLLTLRIPKAAHAQPRKIEIKVT